MLQFLRPTLFCSLLLTLLATSIPAQAHRVHLFAVVEGRDIVADCRFSKSRPAQNSKLQVLNAKDGSLLLEGKTDTQGHFRFPIPQQILNNPIDLKLRLDAGAGHQATWIINATEITPQKGLADSTKKLHSETPLQAIKATSEPATPKKDQSNDRQIQLTEQKLQQIINQSLETKLAPIQAMLMSQQNDDPGFIEIIGGIGWIFGLFGIVAFIKIRKNTQEQR